MVFFDDILVCSPDLETHLVHLEKIFIRLQQHSLKVKGSKCSFGADQVEYLGHVANEKGVAVDPAKIKCIKQWRQPATLKGLRGFLGLAGYYRNFFKNFGIIGKPLYQYAKERWVREDCGIGIGFQKLEGCPYLNSCISTTRFFKRVCT